ncbi:MAG: PEP-CTERM sorting domain-containing protein [Betaproteobacteria bacterium HGW-Betaproteobacteria-13]|jgi:hypothetical protein|nr:MAG: PEP-CTERM sorting domain-containing protein [Betaproteobacteria bacterium HGW-Betaproteobacteria-21]PKO80035.1 MAG: PEP-CTERM sorting domain-containing protein [Betaproteobacteria bacterium HGW-Betaproteobacteria-13]
MKNYTAVALLVSGLSGFSGAASAAWNWDLSCGSFACSQTSSASQTSNPVGGPSVTVTGWSSATSGGGLTQGYIESWSGVGVQYVSSETSAPNHALDNNGHFESVLLDFGSAKVNLDAVNLGYTNNDSDFFVLAYTGTGAPSLGISSYASMTGWTLVGNYPNAGTGVEALNSGSIYSSFWLIGAGGFEAGVGVTSGDKDASGNWRGFRSSRYDYMKVASVSGTVKPTTPGGSVPEPGSLALAGLGVLGLIGMRRRKSER